jgi:hypothetical protein
MVMLLAKVQTLAQLTDFLTNGLRLQQCLVCVESEGIFGCRGN